MAACYRRYIAGTGFDERAQITVLDVGAWDPNGSYRGIFNAPQFRYVGMDVQPGAGIDIVMDDPYAIPLEDRSVDIIICGQMFEHCEFFWRSFTEMVRVMKTDGFFFLIAPSAGIEHRVMVDCYRFLPDSYRALARYAGCQAVEIWRDPREPWYDLVGVFRHSDAPALPTSIKPHYMDAIESLVGSNEENVVKGTASYLDFLTEMHFALEPRLYLEIGVSHGQSLSLAQCPAVGVDPFPAVDQLLAETTKVVAMTSDDFFAGDHRAVLVGAPDFVFIDGDHHFETTLRDFINVERIADPHAVVVFDDMLPPHARQASRRQQTKSWMGDVWRVYDALARYRPELFLQLIDTSPGGALVVYGLDAASTVLTESYGDLVARRGHFDTAPPEEIINRTTALSMQAPAFGAMLAALKMLREVPTPRDEAVTRLRMLSVVGGRTG